MNDLVKDQDRIFTTQERELPGVHIDLAAMLSLLERFKPLYSEFPFKDGPDPNLRFILDNGTYSVGDGVVLYSIMRLYNPRRIIEIGSGMSTCLMMDINERFFDNGISITCIDPYPDRFQDMIAPQDEKLLKIIPQRLQDVDKDMFRSLDANDIVFVDSSHVSKCDSDVNHIFFDVLPYIKPGVLVHFHDIFYPFEYPKRWLLEVGAAWNENYLLHAFLLFNRKFEILFFCDYLNHFYPEKIINSIPVYMDMLGFNFWLRRV